MSEKYQPTPENLQETATGDIAIFVGTLFLNEDINEKSVIVSTSKISNLSNAEKQNWGILYQASDDEDNCEN